MELGERLQAVACAYASSSAERTNGKSSVVPHREKTLHSNAWLVRQDHECLLNTIQAAGFAHGRGRHEPSSVNIEKPGPFGWEAHEHRRWWAVSPVKAHYPRKPRKKWGRMPWMTNTGNWIKGQSRLKNWHLPSGLTAAGVHKVVTVDSEG